MQCDERTVATVAGGLTASFAMDVAQDGWAALFERRRASDDRDEEVEAIAAVVRLMGTVVPALRGARSARIAARMLHYGFGVAFAAAYVEAATRVPAVRTSGGLAFGAGLFVLSDRLLIPLLKLGRPWARYSRAERWNALISHLAYGVVLETIRARVIANARRGSSGSGYLPRMHDEHIPFDPLPADQDFEREAVVAADDTGLVAQQEALSNLGIGDTAGGDAVERESIEPHGI